MDNQTAQNRGVRDAGNTGIEPATAFGASQQAPATPPQVPNQVQFAKQPRSIKKFLIVAAVALLLGLVAVIILLSQQQQNDSSVREPAERFDVMQLPLADLSDLGSLVLGGAKSLSVNGQLQVNNTLVISPTEAPANAVAGQLYYDQVGNFLAYYNGSEFIDLLEQDGGVLSVGGISGSVALGGGLAVSGATISNTGVLSVQGQTGAITLSAGNGIVVDGTTISNTGLLSLAGATGALSLGSGLAITDNSVQNTGVLGVDAGTNITIVDNGDGSYTISSAAGGGTVSSPGGTAGRIAKFTGAQTIEDSLLSESGTTITVNGDLSVSGATTLATPLPVTSGGIGVGTMTLNGVVIGQGTGALTAVAAGGAGQCLVSTAGAPAFQACPGSGGVTSLNGLTGVLTVANASGAGSTITIDDASTSAKGIAQFNATNFSVASGVVNTIQNINTAASPTFNSLGLTGDLGVNGGDITSTGALNIVPFGVLTLGSTSLQAILQGDTNTQITATGGGFTTTVGFTGVASGNVVYNFDRAATAGNYTVCSTAGNCAGVGGGVTTAGGTTNRLSKFTSAQGIGDSTISDDGTNVTTSVDLIVQGGDVTVGVANSQTGAVTMAHSGSGFLGTITQGALTADRTYVLPDASGTFCLTSGNCSGAGSANTLQAAYDAGNTIVTTTGRDLSFNLSDLATDPNFLVDLQCDTACGANGRFAIMNDGVDVFAVNPTGATSVSVTGNVAVTGDLSTTGNTALGDALTDTLSVGATILGGTPLVFEGGAVDASQLSFVIASLSGDQSVTFGDESGTVCLQGSTTCGFASSTNAFVQGGNSFTATAVLGTNDAFALEFETSGTTRATLAADGSSLTLASNVDMLLQGSTAYISNPQSQSNSEAFGLAASVTGANAVATGNAATAAAEGVAVGQGATAVGQAVALGRSAGVSSGSFGGPVSIGFGANAASWGVAIGSGSSTAGNWGTAVGEGASTTGQLGAAFGNGATAAQQSVALGADAVTAGNNQIAIGAGAETTANNQLVIGGSTADGSYITNAYFGSGVSDATPQDVTLHATGGSGTDVAGADLNLAGGAGTGAAAGGNINLQVATPGASGSAANVPATVVGISGNNGSAFFQNTVNSTTAFRILNAAATTTLFNADTTNGRVGIGTTTPGSRLDIVHSDVNEIALQLHALSGQVADIFVAYDGDGDRTTYLNEHGELRVIAANDNTVAMRIKQRSAAQTGNLLEWVDNSNSILSYVDADGNLSVGTGDAVTNNVKLRVAGDNGVLPAIANRTRFVLNNNSVAGDNVGTSLISGTSGQSSIYFGDTDSESPGQIVYDNGGNYLSLVANNIEGLRVDNGGNIDAANHMAIGGGASVNGSNVLTIDETIAPTGGTDGIDSVIRLNPGAADANFHTGIRGQVQTSGGNTQNFTGGLRGSTIFAQHNGTGTLDEAWGSEVYVDNTSTGTITDAVGLRIQPTNNSGGGTITNNYGLYINDQTAGTTDYAIFTGQGTVRFGDVIQATTLGTANTSTHLCRNSSNQIATCATTGAGAVFVQGGNSFGEIATLGTNDAFGLNLETSGTTRVRVAANGSAINFVGTGIDETGLDLVFGNGAWAPRITSIDDASVSWFGEDVLSMQVAGFQLGSSSSDPSYTLDAFNGRHTFYAQNAFGYLQFLNASDDVLMNIDADGAVTLQNSTNSDSALNVLSTTGGEVLTADTTSGIVYVGRAPGGAHAAARLLFGDFGTEGNVSVEEYGTTDTDVLELHGRQGIELTVTNTADVSVLSLSPTGAATFKNTANSTTAFRVQNASSTNVFQVDTTNGFVGIGTTPSNQIDVVGSDSTGSIAEFINSANNSDADNIIIEIGYTGTLGAANNFITFRDGNSATIGQIEGNGSGGTAYQTSSDRRLKENIRSTHFSLQDLMKIQVSDYNFISSGVQTTGFIAQDLYEIYPHAVSVGSDDMSDPWGVDYGALTPLIVKGVQDLANKANDQQAQLDGMSSDVSRLRADMVTSSDLQNGTTDMDISDLKLTGNLEVNGNATFRGAVSVRDITISGHIVAGKDTAGTAVIPAGQTEVSVTFDRPYQRAPKVTTGVSEFVQAAVADKTANGFTIKIAAPHSTDVKVDWTALETPQ